MGFLFRTRARVDRTLHTLGLSFEYALKRTKQESGADAEKNTIYINLRDVSRTMAMRTREHLLLHEVGHLFVAKYCRGKRVLWGKDFVRLFGDITMPYRRNMHGVVRSPDSVSPYADAHPEEAVAEVFAVVVGYRGSPRQVRAFLQRAGKSALVYKQCVLMLRLIQRVAK